MSPDTTPTFGYEEQSLFDKLKNNVAELIEFVAIVGAVIIVVRFFVAEPHKVDGSSMVPNFHTGDYIITNKLATRLSPPQRGEVIILKNPRDTSVAFIKRVIGLPGEKVMVKGGNVFVNDKKLSEPYLPKELKTPAGAFLGEGEEVIVPPHQYFVMGDNRPASSDSREWGPVESELIVGQAFLRYWPPQKFTLLKIEEPSL